MADKQKAPPPFQFGPPEKTNWIKILLFVAFVVVGISAIVVMVESSPPMPHLTCRSYTGAGLWSAFGRCTPD
jgi:hypothetical protein